MENYDSNNMYAQRQYQEAEPLGVYTSKTFMWMFLGLLLTFVVAVAGYVTGAISYVFTIPYFQFILLALEVGVVIFLSARINKMSVTTARVLFFTYALLNGVVFSAYFIMFQVTSLVIVFAATAVYFGAMAAYGYVTKTDLAGIRPILTGGLIFLIVFWVLSMFLPLGGMERIMCLVGIVIFMGFTAYDTQKIKAYHAAYANDAQMLQKASIFSALQLYLDFVNLFIYLLRIVGKRN